MRARFGDQVHERLVDPLVGSIYAADTDRFSLHAVPQLADLAARSAQRAAGRRGIAAAAPTGPVFYAPRGGMGALVDAAAVRRHRLGGDIQLGTPCQTLEVDGDGWRVDGEYADAVVLACPAAQAARLAGSTSIGRRPLAAIEYADVVLITVAIPRGDWPERLHGLSGYLVPKPVQRMVTAVSFGSQKWAHWHDDDSVVLRISLGRDGLPVLHLSDDDCSTAALDRDRRHLGIDLQPTAVRSAAGSGRSRSTGRTTTAWSPTIEAELPPSLVRRRRQLSRHRHPGVHPLGTSERPTC